MKNYNEEFKNLVNEAIDNGWHPYWVDLCEGNNIYMVDIDTNEKEDDFTQFFYFESPQEWEESLEESELE